MLNFKRHRRLRESSAIRSLVKEYKVHKEDLIYPIFLTETHSREITSMPGSYNITLNQLDTEIKTLDNLGIQGIMLFGVPESKDEVGSTADNPEGIVQQGIRRIKSIAPNMYVIADTCLCQYTSHGHCGVIGDLGEVDNDLSLGRLNEIALSYAHAGADMVAPSNMMDGFVQSIRTTLDSHGFNRVSILSYTVKYASAFYGPFRTAVDCSPQFGDRKSYQMDPANAREALREAFSDISEGADMLMVKPGLAYMDIIYRLREATNLPLVAYNVSGEYSMIKAAAQNGWLDERSIVLEMLTSFKRAGADLIITYFAKEAAKWL